ncbi:hypothetical protein B0O99DRAFT_629162 [Bisporella sp. PMI_857]|nr:hypothetical protein B0O99DRAFT_629162 [Bisporella sp. PMI_857]
MGILLLCCPSLLLVSANKKWRKHMQQVVCLVYWVHCVAVNMNPWIGAQVLCMEESICLNTFNVCKQNFIYGDIQVTPCGNPNGTEFCCGNSTACCEANPIVIAATSMLFPKKERHTNRNVLLTYFRCSWTLSYIYITM